MLRVLQDEFAGLKSRWLRVLALLTCLAMVLVIAEQQRAIEAQGNLISVLSGDSNQQKLKAESQPKVSIYITDSKILEPAKTPEPPAPTARPSPARIMKQI
jgi:hypothetical protein